jgi:hypothetical protein
MSTPLRISGSPLLPMMRFREREVGFVMGRHQLAGKQQAPGGGVNEQRRAAADVRLPVTVADFVADQRIAGGFVRNTQQRFRQTHQRHAFLRGKRKLLEQALDHTGAAGGGFLVTQLFSKLIRQLVRLGGDRLRQAGLFQQHRDGVGFGAAVGPVIAARLTDCGRICSANSRNGWWFSSAAAAASSLSFAAPLSRAGSSGNPSSLSSLSR